MKKAVYMENMTYRMIEHIEKEEQDSIRFPDCFCFAGVSRNRKETTSQNIEKAVEEI